VKLQVPVRTLDEFSIDPVGFIKIDVEGHELEVLAGGMTTIAANLPALLIEVEEQHRAGSREEVIRRLRPFGYKPFFLQNGALRPAERFIPNRDQNPLRPLEYVRNFLFLPQNRLKDFQAEITDR
jgi:hypothetical protein